MTVHQLKPRLNVTTRLEDYVFLSQVISNIWKGAETVGVCNALAGACALSEDPMVQDKELSDELTWLWQHAYRRTR